MRVYSMMTTTPNEVVKPIHPSRMPVILRLGSKHLDIPAYVRRSAPASPMISVDPATEVDAPRVSRLDGPEEKPERGLPAKNRVLRMHVDDVNERSERMRKDTKTEPAFLRNMFD